MEATTNTLPWGRYAELRPDQLEAIVAASPVAYVPWGALEWHGPHLPLGLEGITAEALAERVVRRTGGVLLPTTWWPITALPHRFSLSIRSDVIQALWDGIFAELVRAGFRLVVLLSGHYAQAHELVLMDAAEHAIAAHGLMVLAVPPLALVDEEMLDHAAHWETALLLALRPRLVDLDALDGMPLHPAATAVLGNDPRRATAGQGESALRLATERIAVGVEALLNHGGPDVLRELYARRRAVYQRYVDRYFRGSWEEAALAWWAEKSQL
ncbi:MAG TPA: creatininase family protein [Roseiflexaceae bacterium]